jgi:hypothetical protein
MIDLAAELREVCALDGAGGLWCWGDGEPRLVWRGSATRFVENHQRYFCFATAEGERCRF